MERKTISTINPLDHTQQADSHSSDPIPGSFLDLSHQRLKQVTFEGLQAQAPAGHREGGTTPHTGTLADSPRFSAKCSQAAHFLSKVKAGRVASRWWSSPAPLVWTERRPVKPTPRRGPRLHGPASRQRELPEPEPQPPRCWRQNPTASALGATLGLLGSHARKDFCPPGRRL
ncbi:uncharacterized protein LOC144377322 [Ictidomys tridecemlineatus]